MPELVDAPVAVATLGEGWFGAGLEPEVQERLAGLAHTARYTSGEIILREGEATTHLGIVLTGRVALRLRIPERGPVTILTVEPGDIVGWSAIVPPHRATSTVVAVLDTGLALMDGARLRSELAGDAAFAAVFYPRVLRALTRRLEGTRLQLLDLFAAPGLEPW
jgi:CRP/FNR family transcriptional regulator, cyclic AMP receptor protein